MFNVEWLVSSSQVGHLKSVVVAGSPSCARYIVASSRPFCAAMKVAVAPFAQRLPLFCSAPCAISATAPVTIVRSHSLPSSLPTHSTARAVFTVSLILYRARPAPSLSIIRRCGNFAVLGDHVIFIIIFPPTILVLCRPCTSCSPTVHRLFTCCSPLGLAIPGQYNLLVQYPAGDRV